MAKGKIGQCALCEKVTVLRDSHLIPKAAYRHIRDEPNLGGGSPLRVHVAEKEAFQTDLQIKKHLLCGDCEQLFTRKGESLVSKYWATRAGFPLLDYLESRCSIGHRDNLTVYDVNGVEPNLLEALYYFGVSVIWRSSRWDWGRRKSHHLNSLGDNYDKAFRDYLLGRVGRMEHVRLFLIINNNPDLNGLICFPYCVRNRMSRYHKFIVLGLHFNFIVGKGCDLEVERLCKYFDSDVLIAGSDYAKSKEAFDVARAFQKIKLKTDTSDALI